MSRLRNKVTVITGGNSGIGFGIAQEFKNEGLGNHLTIESDVVDDDTPVIQDLTYVVVNLAPGGCAGDVTVVEAMDSAGVGRDTTRGANQRLEK